MSIPSLKLVANANLESSLGHYKGKLPKEFDDHRVVSSESGFFGDASTFHDQHIDAGLRARWKKPDPSGTSQAEENNFARQCLLKYALDTFRKTRFADLPASVKKAFNVGFFKDDMKLNGEGVVTSGRPLTRRRVNLVVTAVANEVERTQSPVANEVKRTQSPVANEVEIENNPKEKVKGLVNAIIYDLTEVAERYQMKEEGDEVIQALESYSKKEDAQVKKEDAQVFSQCRKFAAKFYGVEGAAAVDEILERLDEIDKILAIQSF